MLARHSTFDIQKLKKKKIECRADTTFDIRHSEIKLQKIECRAGPTFDIRHSKVEKKTNVVLARHTTFDIQKLKKNLNGVEQRP